MGNLTLEEIEALRKEARAAYRVMDAQSALTAGVKRAAAEIKRIGGIEQFIRPGEHVPASRPDTIPAPSISAQEYIRRRNAGEYRGLEQKPHE